MVLDLVELTLTSFAAQILLLFKLMFVAPLLSTSVLRKPAAIPPDTVKP